MSSPSSFGPSPSMVEQKQKQKQKSNNMMVMCPEQIITRQLSNISNDGYHGGEPASVPFMWESQPGTPKVKFRDNSLPPLTPPPSYSYNANKRSISKANKSSSKPNLLQTIFPKRTTRKARAPSPSLSFSSSSSSSSSYSSSPRLTSRSVPSTPLRCSRKEEEGEDLYDVPGSGLCFGNVGSRGCYSSMIKKILPGDFL